MIEKSKSWKIFEEKVSMAYKILGYKTTKNINIDGKQVDILCQKNVPGLGDVKIFVECKYLEKTNSISNNDVDIFISNFISRKTSNGWTKGVLVSNKEFSQYALATAITHSDISLKTLSDLEEDIFNIRDYLTKASEEIKQEFNFSHYVPLKSKKSKTKDKSESRSRDLRNTVERWIDKNEEGNQLWLLGDFGSGKSTFLKFLFATISKAYLEGKYSRLPIFITLRNYANTQNIEELIERFFANEVAAKISFTTFKKFLQEGRFLVLFDGFDEMGDTSDTTTRKENYLKLSQLSIGNSKVLITCRPAYFMTWDEFRHLFQYLDPQIGFNKSPFGMRRTDKNIQQLAHELHNQTSPSNLRSMFERSEQSFSYSRIEHLQLFTKQQIKSYLKKKSQDIHLLSKGFHNGDSVYEMIKEIYDLEDLTRRPILLKLVTDTLPSFIKSGTGSFHVEVGGRKLALKEATPSILYYVYTERELEREYRKGKTRWYIERKSKHSFISLLAYEMFLNNTQAFNRDEFRYIVAQKFSNHEDNIDFLETDIRTCSFLTRDRNDLLRFAHKSFLEYFAAQFIITLMINSPTPIKDILRTNELPEDILYFLGDWIFTFQDQLIKNLNRVSLTETNDAREKNIARQNTINILNFSRHPPPIISKLNSNNIYYLKNDLKSLVLTLSTTEKLYLRKSKIQNLEIQQMKFKELFISNSYLSNTEIDKTVADLFTLHGSTVSAKINNTKISRIEASTTTIKNSIIKNSIIGLDTSAEMEITNLIIKDSLIAPKSYINFPNSTIDKLLFTNCIFWEVMIDAKAIDDCKFVKCCFIRCSTTSPKIVASLKGSIGFFIHEKSDKHDIEEQNIPYYWSHSRANSLSLEISNTNNNTKRKEEIKEKRTNIFKNSSFCDVLSFAFPQTSRRQNLDIDKIKNKIKVCSFNPEKLI